MKHARQIGKLPDVGKQDETERDDENRHNDREDAEDEANDAGDVARGVHAILLEAVRFRELAVRAAHGQPEYIIDRAQNFRP